MSSLDDRLPLPAPELMTEAQRAAANDLIAGPRKGVKGPFIPLLRSPELMSRLQKVGEYLRFQSLLAPKLSEFATLCVARSWSQQFEWVMHVPLALKAGICKDTIDAIRDGRRPSSMSPADAAVHDFVAELQNTKGVAQATYDSVIAEVGDQGRSIWSGSSATSRPCAWCSTWRTHRPSQAAQLTCCLHFRADEAGRAPVRSPERPASDSSEASL